MLGYNNLSLILDQERKHWLMKTDKKKQVQDKTTGDLFQSQIDNIGSDIIIETEKLPYKFDFIPEIKFNTQNVDYILGLPGTELSLKYSKTIMLSDKQDGFFIARFVREG